MPTLVDKLFQKKEEKNGEQVRAQNFCRRNRTGRGGRLYLFDRKGDKILVVKTIIMPPPETQGKRKERKRKRGVGRRKEGKIRSHVERMTRMCNHLRQAVAKHANCVQSFSFGWYLRQGRGLTTLGR